LRFVDTEKCEEEEHVIEREREDMKGIGGKGEEEDDKVNNKNKIIY